ncbi:MAG TPA: acyl-CoA dehydrogenase family protein, partial [Pyrinomonadaceae bacterium]|nr:acyl-CoA dehydrogenase family protein [Pyrinomonadaceae bacterium]
MDPVAQKDYIKGGEFLISEGSTATCFTPEDFTDEHRMIGEMAREYIDNEVVPQLPALEGHAWEVARDLLKKAGELGLLGANISEELGGMALDQTTGVIIAEAVKEVARPAMFAILIILVVFAPLFSLESMEGKMFKPMA